MGRGNVSFEWWQVDRRIQAPCGIWLLEPSFIARIPVCSLFSSCTTGTSVIFILWAATSCSYLGEWAQSYFTSSASFCRTNPALSFFGTAECIACGQQGWCLMVLGRVWILFSVVLMVTEMARSRLSCLSQRLETWKFSRTVSLPYVENSSIDYFPGWSCMLKADASTRLTHINPSRRDQHKLCVNVNYVQNFFVGFIMLIELTPCRKLCVCSFLDSGH